MNWLPGDRQPSGVCRRDGHTRPRSTEPGWGPVKRQGGNLSIKTAKINMKNLIDSHTLSKFKRPRAHIDTGKKNFKMKEQGGKEVASGVLAVPAARPGSRAQIRSETESDTQHFASAFP